MLLPRRAIRTLCLLPVWAALAGGCDAGSDTGYGRMQEQRDAALETSRRMRRRLEDVEAENEAMRRQVESLKRLGDDRMDALFTVTGIDLGRTDAVNTDGRPGHDAIKVYVMPTDRDGDTLKAAGDVTIQLFALAAADGRRLLGEYHFPPDKLADHWSSTFFRHFSFVCPWKDSPPEHEEVTVRVVFVDVLTGKVFTAQKVVKVVPGTAKA